MYRNYAIIAEKSIIFLTISEIGETFGPQCTNWLSQLTAFKYKIWFSGPPFDRSRFFPQTVQTDPIPNEIGRDTEDKEAQISIKVKIFNVARNFHSFRMSVSFFAEPANYTIIIYFKF